MKTWMRAGWLPAFALVSLLSGAQTNNSSHTNTKNKEDKMTVKKAAKEYVRFIDKFLVPAGAKQEFIERMNINREFIKTLPGFIEDVVYERTDEQGNFICITVAVWENEEAVKQAKEKVQAEYQQQGFDPVKMFERLHITMDRGIYKVMKY